MKPASAFHTAEGNGMWVSNLLAALKANLNNVMQSNSSAWMLCVLLGQPSRRLQQQLIFIMLQTVHSLRIQPPRRRALHVCAQDMTVPCAESSPNASYSSPYTGILPQKVANFISWQQDEAAAVLAIDSHPGSCREADRIDLVQTGILHLWHGKESGMLCS